MIGLAHYIPIRKRVILVPEVFLMVEIR